MTWKPACASAGTWWRQSRPESGKPCSRTTGRPSPVTSYSIPTPSTSTRLIWHLSVRPPSARAVATPLSPVARRAAWCGRGGQGGELSVHGGGLGGADAGEHVAGLAEQGRGLRGVPGCPGAAGDARQAVGLVPGAGYGAGQVQGSLVTPPRVRKFPADLVQRPALVERLGLATPVAQVTVDAQGLIQR